MRAIPRTIVITLLLATSAGKGAAYVPITDPTVAVTEGGEVRGVVADGVLGFKGIPYAEPPVGPLRWRAPQPVTPWEGVLEATEFGASCMQVGDSHVSEDCLTLNVWRPAGELTTPLPVMVWIHGGGMVRGGAHRYPGDALARQGVVMVTMNYRLGRLGYFAHPALVAEAPNDPRGNYGLMDQVAALQWVQRNIAAFGGDPKQVTIFGESAGGGSVMVHLTSPVSRGLFQRAILQSPGLPTARARVIPLTELAVAEKLAVEYANAMGAAGDGAPALRALRALPAERLIEGASAPEVLAGLVSGKPVLGVAGTIRDGRLVVEAPEAVFAASRQARVPVVVGANDREVGLGAAGSKEELFAHFGALAGEARRTYDPNGDQPLDELKQQVFADRTIVEPSRHLAGELARTGQPVWWYRFAYVAESQRGALLGTLHGYEIPYVLNVPGALVGGQATPADQAMAELTSAYWVSFAKTGDPNGGDRPTWPRHAPTVDRVLQFKKEGVLAGLDPLKARLDLWEKVWKRSP